MSEDKFDEEKFMKVLVKLKDTQESIQGRFHADSVILAPPASALFDRD